MKTLTNLILISLISLTLTEEYITFPYTIEAETCDGAEVWTTVYEHKIGGEYSGEGFYYLTGGTISFTVNIEKEGLYQINAKLAQILNEEGRFNTIVINGIEYGYTIPYYDSWTDFDFGVHRLKQGSNTIGFIGKYGYIELDTITISEPVFPDFSNMNTTLTDPKATPEAKKLMEYLGSVYGKKIISGQQEIYGNGHDGNIELEFEFLYKTTGKYPAIRGFDFMNYNPLYGWDDQTTERIIEWVLGRGGIATASWHLNVPTDFDSYKVGEEVEWSKTTYTPQTTFKTGNTTIKGTKENAFFNLAIEDLAEQLLRLQEKNIPIILRPLHEAEGNQNTDGSGAWFWWGKAGAKVYVEIWKYLYEKLTNEYDLHNIIWEQNLYTWSPDSIQWYAGDDYVDLVAYDKYNTAYNRHDGKTTGPNLDAESTVFYSLVKMTKNKKMVAMAENDSIPGLDNLLVEKAAWLYFCPWYNEWIMDQSKNDPADLNVIYNSDYCITLDELPNLKP